MNIFQVLQLFDSEICPQDCKVHLAKRSGKGDNPLDVYLAGDFDQWQEWQTKENFRRRLVLSLIQLPLRNRWLFAGVHESHGLRLNEETDRCIRYHLKRCESTNELCGRLIIEFERPGRQSYLRAERWINKLRVAELRAEKYQVAEFSGFNQTMLTKSELDVLVRQQIASWRSALSCVAGVYVISDTHTGMLYIGSATGEHGIWGRWCQYSTSGHAGNKELKSLLNEKGAEYSENFLFGILETADRNATENDMLIRESHWKNLLLTRTHGYNSN